MGRVRERAAKVIVIGFGGVGRAFAGLAMEQNDRLYRDHGFRLEIVAVSDRNSGSLVSPNGIDLGLLAASVRCRGEFVGLPGGSAEARTDAIIREVPADIVIEATSTDPVDGEPAASYCLSALQAGKHVVTCNKGPVAFAGKGLAALALRKGLAIAYEGSVMSGTPVIRMARQLLVPAGISAFEGILNGTSNYVLGRMEDGLDLSLAVEEAQMKGYAEADPTADIEGHDVRLKVVIMANQLLAADILPRDVAMKGISGLTPDDMRVASAAGQRWKLLGRASRDHRGNVEAEVLPVRLPAAHVLEGIGGVTNAIVFKTDVLGDVFVSGPGAGRTETAFALLSDIISIY